MVIEKFRNRDPGPIGERFRRDGRMLPADVAYVGSWVDAAEGRCFQIMEARSAESLAPWIRCWEDLVDFEIVPVETSADFWARVQP
jgi:hypothetical protein